MFFLLTDCRQWVFSLVLFSYLLILVLLHEFSHTLNRLCKFV
ncbi:DUF2933 domain-containing protein [Paucisalibacillus globulus]